MSGTKNQTILVTGASGFVAAHVIEVFLAAGYKVRGTVRSESTGERVRQAHPNFPAEQLEFAIVPDISTPGAFDEAVKGVDGVIHTASPFTFAVTDFDKDLFEPAVKGTTSVLQAVKKNNSKVKRVVITSSFASVLDPTKGLRPGYTYTEADWNPVSAQDAKDQNSAVVAYLVSKTLAERAAWDFVKTENPEFSVVTLCPPMVYGPLAQEFDSMDKLNTSSGDVYRLFNGSEKDAPSDAFPGLVDARDRKLLLTTNSMQKLTVYSCYSSLARL
jgi:nucleoside-diphosphate-sugar epimerase